MKTQFDKKRFRRMFPHLTKELNGKKQRIVMDSVRSDLETGEKASSDKFSTYIPDVVDFIRRCDSDQQAEEIISYLEKRGEISLDYAQRLRKQLKEKGVRSFGAKKEEGYYLRQGGF